MNNGVIKWIRIIYNRAVSSIALYPVLLALAFLVLSWFMLELDFSETGKMVKERWKWLRLRDASTARTIVSTITAAVISLTVFSFTLVMIILNQAASQISNRTLDTMTGNKFQQLVLGFYIGTVVYGLFLLSSISDLDSGVQVPALSVYLLIIFTVVNIFLFIYFLHYVTQMVKYGTIIARIRNVTADSILKRSAEVEASPPAPTNLHKTAIKAPSSGYYQGFEKKTLINWAEENNCSIYIHFRVGSFLAEGIPIMTVHGKKTVSKQDSELICSALFMYEGQQPRQHYYYGFLQLTEIAVKALSPGINDPSTAVLAMNALTELFALLLKNKPATICFSNSKPRIISEEWTFEELLPKCLDPIWHYGKEDPFVQNAFKDILKQLGEVEGGREYESLFGKFLEEI